MHQLNKDFRFTVHFLKTLINESETPINKMETLKITDMESLKKEIKCRLLKKRKINWWNENILLNEK